MVVKSNRMPFVMRKQIACFSIVPTDVRGGDIAYTSPGGQLKVNWGSLTSDQKFDANVSFFMNCLNPPSTNQISLLGKPVKLSDVGNLVVWFDEGIASFF